MLGNLKTPPEPFADIIRTHFRLKANSLRAQLSKWVEMDDGRGTEGSNHGTTLSQTASAAHKKWLFAVVEELKEWLVGLDGLHGSGPIEVDP